MVPAPVLLPDAEGGQFVFEGVTPAAAALSGVPDGVDHAVVGERGCGGTVFGDGGAEGVQDDAAGGAGVGR